MEKKFLLRAFWVFAVVFMLNGRFIRKFICVEGERVGEKDLLFRATRDFSRESPQSYVRFCCLMARASGMKYPMSMPFGEPNLCGEPRCGVGIYE